MIKMDGRVYKYTEGTKRYYRVMAYSDGPLTLPIAVTDVEGMTATDAFAPGSIIYIVANGGPSKVYMCDNTGTFVPQ